MIYVRVRPRTERAHWWIVALVLLRRRLWADVYDRDMRVVRRVLLPIGKVCAIGGAFAIGLADRQQKHFKLDSYNRFRSL